MWVLREEKMRVQGKKEVWMLRSSERGGSGFNNFFLHGLGLDFINELTDGEVFFGAGGLRGFTLPSPVSFTQLTVGGMQKINGPLLHDQ